MHVIILLLRYTQVDLNLKLWRPKTPPFLGFVLNNEMILYVYVYTGEIRYYWNKAKSFQVINQPGQPNGFWDWRGEALRA